MKNSFDKIQKNFGFGFMRLPMSGDNIDIQQTKKMVDLFMSSGFNYFDTAHGYINEKSELALKECLTSRYPRESYVLTNKLSFNYFNSQEDIRPLFKKQLEACGVDYFDFYLMHAQSKARMPHYRQTRAYETVMELKQEGKIRHMGISFHDKAEVLDEILTEHPEIEIVQIQFNYVDYEDEKVESRKCYEVCRKHNKPVIVMEPVKGGSLVKLPDSAQNVLNQLHGGSNASYAIRFAAGFDGIKMVLSGMSDMQQVEDNVGFMREFKPLDHTEREAVEKVSAIIRSQGTVPCTGCRYCTEVCPQAIPIPEIITALNNKRQSKITEAFITKWACIKCGKCEDICPQQLNIREILTAAEAELYL